MDNCVSGRTENLEDIFYHDRFTYFEHDITKFIHLSGDLDWVLHLASLASPVFYRENPIKTRKVGAQGTHKTLGLAREKTSSTSSRRRARSTAIRTSIPSRKTTEETLTRSVRCPVTTSRSATAKR
jgi:hypothetical protein